MLRNFGTFLDQVVLLKWAHHQGDLLHNHHYGWVSIHDDIVRIIVLLSWDLIIPWNILSPTRSVITRYIQDENTKLKWVPIRGMLAFKEVRCWDAWAQGKPGLECKYTGCHTDSIRKLQYPTAIYNLVAKHIPHRLPGILDLEMNLTISNHKKMCNI